MQDWRLCQTFGGLECDQRRDETRNFVALQRVCRCGLRVGFVASECLRTSLPCCARAAVGRAFPSMHPNAQEFRRIRTPKKFCSAFARKKGCSQVIVFFYRPTCSYRFMFFIGWKLPPPACPGTTGNWTYNMAIWTYNHVE